MITRRAFLKLAAQTWLAGMAVVGFATGVEAMGRPDVVTYRLTPPGWTPGLRLKVVMLADFHACEPWMSAERIAGICEQANALGGDIILLLGDYETSMKVVTGYLPPDTIAGALKGLTAPLGVHAILGNHDCWADAAFQADPTREVRIATALKAAGIRVYVNEAVRLEKDGLPFWLAGLGDQIALKPDRSRGRKYFTGVEDPAEMMMAVTDDAPMLLMAHEPYYFAYGLHRAALTLSGHTHGGQINLFGWTPFVKDPHELQFRGGHYVMENRHLLVSKGLGCSGVPMRIGAWPQIVVAEIG